VALIRKRKPAWQRGKLNGIGGKLENGEKPLAAMRREFKEETTLDVAQWTEFAQMTGTDFSCHCFAAKGKPHECKSPETEKVGVYHARLVSSDQVDNLRWLIGLAINKLETGRPAHCIAICTDS
jgi:8-oxo-dGTP diphosphatase